jgi:ATP-dependent protease HslVU (ClpYQ) peptidase subunit
MTCIVGLVDNGKVYIGGDSAGVAGLSLQVRADEKVFQNGEFLMGFTSSFRMGQLLRFNLNVPKQYPDVEDYQYMVTTFVDAVRNCLRDGGYARNKSGEEFGGTFLVGYKGNLYGIEDDFQVAKYVDGYSAVGCGAEIALGSLHASRCICTDLSPHDRVLLALDASERFSAGVRAPFKVLDI